jgi:hypothetical protein
LLVDPLFAFGGKRGFLKIKTLFPLAAERVVERLSEDRVSQNACGLKQKRPG